MNMLEIIGREKGLFHKDIAAHEKTITDAISGSRVLIAGGAGSIGKEVVRQFFRRSPAALHVMDLSENNLTELVRDLRSSDGYMDGETKFLPLDMGSVEADAFFEAEKPYDYILNLAAMKHVRSEKDAWSLMRMIKTNILDANHLYQRAATQKARKYFAVSTDKAKNPANLMGATKRIMEDILFQHEDSTPVSTARFANVAFSDGSLLHGFRQRLMLQQPLSAPKDVRRYFVTGEESGLLCLSAATLGHHREIFFPHLKADLHLERFSDIAIRFLEAQGYEPVEMQSEDEARQKAADLIPQRKWPVYFFESDTSGEKSFEEFYADDDEVNWDRFNDLGVITVPALTQAQVQRANLFKESILALRERGAWTKADLVGLISTACPELNHIETGKFLDNKM